MSLLPINESKELRGVEVATTLDINIDFLTTLPLKAKKEVLPYLAKVLKVSIEDLDEDEARLYIQNALEVHRVKGTLYALKKAVDSMFNSGEVIEWIESEKEPFTFDCKVNLKSDVDKAYTFKKFIKVREIINISKNVRSHMKHFLITMPIAKQELKFYGSALWQI